MIASLRRDRSIIGAGLLLVVALGWAYLLVMARDMGAMDASMGMPSLRPWTGTEFALTFVMWAVMMVAMMVPSASPMVLMVGATVRRRSERSPAVEVALFVLGYLAIWTAFSALATLAQWGLHSAALLSPMLATTSAVAGGLLLVGAGIFQWTPLKQACLHHCRTPLGFVMTRWREGRGGAFAMGLDHGAYCVGCCWILMALLFVGGVMNLAWVAAIAAFVLLEKVVPAGPWIGRGAGVLLVAWGAAVLLGLAA